MNLLGSAHEEGASLGMQSSQGAWQGLSMHVLPEKRPRAGPLPSPLERLPDRTEGMSGLGSVCASTPSLLSLPDFDEQCLNCWNQERLSRGAN